MRCLLLHLKLKYVLQFKKIRRPETSDLGSPKSVNFENKETQVSRDERDPIQRWR